MIGLIFVLRVCACMLEDLECCLRVQALLYICMSRVRSSSIVQVVMGIDGLLKLTESSIFQVGESGDLQISPVQDFRKDCSNLLIFTSGFSPDVEFPFESS